MYVYMRQMLVFVFTFGRSMQAVFAQGVCAHARYRCKWCPARTNDGRLPRIRKYRKTGTQACMSTSRRTYVCSCAHTGIHTCMQTYR